MIRGRPRRIHDRHPSIEGETIGVGIITDLRDGLFKSDACARAGISTDLLDDWMDRGATQEAKVRTFCLDAHPAALDCDHTFTDGWCGLCGTNEVAWRELVTSDEDHGEFVVFMRDVQRAEADAKAHVLKGVLACLAPLERRILHDDDGQPVRKDGELVSYMPGRGDHRAGAWWLERRDPTQYHLGLRTQDAGVEHEPEPIGQQVLDDVADMAERLGTLD